MAFFNNRIEESTLAQSRFSVLSRIEIFVIVGMLLTLLITGWDAFEGHQVGQGKDLSVAKLKAQQELMANTAKDAQ